MTDGKGFGGIGIGPGGPSGNTVSARIDRELASVLNHLIHLGRDLSAACDVAVPRLESEEYKAHLGRLEKSHATRIEQLSEWVTELGHEPAKHGDIRSLLEQGRVYIATLKGDDGILKAMATNEEVMHTAYREALAHPGLPQELAELLSSALEEEDLHQALYDRALGRFVG